MNSEQINKEVNKILNEYLVLYRSEYKNTEPQVLAEFVHAKNYADAELYMQMKHAKMTQQVLFETAEPEEQFKFSIQQITLLIKQK